MSDFRTHRWIFPGFILGILLMGGCALAQKLPDSIRTSPSAAQSAPQIDAFVTSQVAKLKTAGSERDARIALINQVSTGSVASQSFCDTYATSINTALKPLAADKDLRVRLNAAVVNAEVARGCRNYYQAEVTLLFMKDKSQPVVIWGLKAAKYEIPAQLQAQAVLRKPNLIVEVVPAVKARGAAPELDDGPLIEEAYAALTLSPDGSEAFVKTATDAGIADLLPQVFALLEFRTSLYAVAAPPSPLVDNAAALFLVKNRVWHLESKAQQDRTMKDLYELLNAISNLWAPGQGMDDLMNLTRANGRAFTVIGQQSSNQALITAADNIAKINDSTTQQAFQAAVAELKTAAGIP